MFKKLLFFIGLGFLALLFFNRASGAVVSEPWGMIIAQLKRIEMALTDISINQNNLPAESEGLTLGENLQEDNPSFGSGFFLGRCAISEASTTMRFIHGGDVATSSPLLCDIDGADMIDLNILFVASSSTSTLTWAIDFSTNGGDWFGEEGKTVDNNVVTTHGASTKVHRWTPAVTSSTATSSKNVGIEPLAAKKMRVFFQPMNDNGKVWAEIVKREQFRR